ncbi:uncharacterized protein LOC129729560 [Wyeomyia smithii]|uniref:uncharacterized protein LOC129729560 n=1 Tax=Wyeomyia smithii TaxID=174621 RepID=UPI002467D8D7|nr:uncharacterized protein LOC129729560 [Wyeomyia smithii]XP_055544192.1 uncharacterized protein LOC129729560 [Wyeomyia smithii]XP_055544193.1 uncharacterized protein LOC129729560 [Wyeomyia smithii]
MFGCMLENCSRSFSIANEYLHHIKIQHMVPTTFKYICTVQKCGQIFSSYFPFKKHIVKHQLTSFKSEHVMDTITNLVITANDTSPDDVSIKKRKKENESQEPGCSWNSLNQIDRSALNFTLKQHAKSNFNRKDVYSVQNDVTELLTKLSNHIVSLNVASSDIDNTFIFNSTMEQIKVMFKNVNSDYKLFKYIESTIGLQTPSVITVENNERSVFPIQQLEIDKEPAKNFLIIMPILYQIKTFFESENIFEQTIENQTRLEKSSVIANFINGSKWLQVKEKYGNEIVIPVWLYGDEFEVNDSQSSHSNRHSVSGIYFSFPTIPETYASKLNNIFVAGMLKKIDIKDVGINKLFGAIIEVFTHIEVEGIKLEIEGKAVQVKFVLSLLQGDNLGIHSILSFSSGLNATFHCRFCRRPKELFKTDVVEHADCARRRVDYEEDVEINKLCETGIAGCSIFNNLPSFHVTENRSVDAMHDLFSTGVCKYGLV